MNTACAPPPGAYNPGTIDKSVGPVIHKTERFTGSKFMIHASSTDSVNSLSSERGTSSTGCFSTFKTVSRFIHSQIKVRRNSDRSLRFIVIFAAENTEYLSSHIAN